MITQKEPTTCVLKLIASALSAGGVFRAAAVAIGKTV